MSSMLITLGDGNWRMGEGMIPGAKARIEESNEPERVILEHFTCKSVLPHERFQAKPYLLIVDIISALLTTLTTISRFLKRPALTAIFMLNNVSYLRDRVLLAPRSNIDDLLSAPTQETLNSNFRSSKVSLLLIRIRSIRTQTTEYFSGGIF